ncbi:MAG: nucleoside monophosphate kinase [Candidatus Saccharibacteria bacterium]
MKQLVIIVGLPGSGKDTQIDLLSKSKKIEVIKVGKLIRDLSNSNDDIKKVMQSGGLVDSNLVNNIIKDQIDSYAQDSLIIADGYPRSLDQAEWLEEYAKNNDIELINYVLLSVPDSEAITRLLKRGRMDDVSNIIQNRINIFHSQTEEVIEHYKHKSKFISVDGVGTIEEVEGRMKTALGW